MTFLQQLESHLNLVPVIVAAVQAYQTICHSKQTTVEKIGEIIQVSALVGEQIPIAVVQNVSALIENIATQVFTPAAKPAVTA